MIAKGATVVALQRHPPKRTELVRHVRSSKPWTRRLGRRHFSASFEPRDVGSHSAGTISGTLHDATPAALVCVRLFCALALYKKPVVNNGGV